MDQALKKTGLSLIVIGLVVMPAAPILGGLVDSAALRHAGSLTTSFGAGIFTFGCMQIAKAKGQPWYYGLLGFLSCIGLAVLWFVIPDKHPEAQ